MFASASGISMMAGDTVGNAQVGRSFVCAWCQKTFPIAESMPKGSQLVCKKDNASTSAFNLRAKANPKLRSWWQSLSADEKAEWYRRWQTVTGKRRFDEIEYTEESVQAEEDIFDEVDQWIPFSCYWERNKGRPGITYASCERALT